MIRLRTMKTEEERKMREFAKKRKKKESAFSVCFAGYFSFLGSECLEGWLFCFFFDPTSFIFFTFPLHFASCF